MSLSGGEKQKLTIAIAILSKRNILFFDEPTSGMDYKNMIIISTRLREIANQGKIIIVITHDKEFIKETCDRIINLENYSKIN